MKFCETKKRQFEDFTKELIRKHEIPGLSVAVMKNGSLVYSQGFGHRNREETLPATPQTVYGIGSVTKSFTAKAIMLLAEREKLSAGDPVREYLPDFFFADDDTSDTISIHHFLTHTSGIPPTPALKFALKDSYSPQEVAKLKKQDAWEQFEKGPAIHTAQQLMSFLADYDEEPLGRPGEKFSYSNDACALLGTIIERVSGQSYEQFVEQNILKPLGMEPSYFHPDQLDGDEDVTELYVNDNDEVTRSEGWLHAPAMVSAGFLKTSPLNMVKYGQAYLQSSLLSSNSLNIMSSPFYPCGRGSHYGYGLRIHPNYNDVTVVEHGGSIKGVSAQFGFIPEVGVTAAVLANLQNVPVLKIWRGVINALLDIPLQSRWDAEPEYECPPEQLSRYLGLYRSGEGNTIRVQIEDDELVAYVNQERKKLRPSGIDTAAIMRRGEEVGLKFVPGPTGQIDSVFYGLRILRRVN